MIYLYRQPKQNEQFVVGADPGEGGDYSAFVVLSKFNAEVVMIGRSKEESPQLGHTLNAVGKWFYDKSELYPTIAVERNVGSAAIYVLKEHNYPELFKMPTSFTKEIDKDSEQYGWHTNTATRPKMLDDLALAIRTKVIFVPSQQVIDELFSFIRHPRTGKPQAETGSNDDLVMSLAIAWQLYQVVPRKDIFDMAEWEAQQAKERAEIDARY